MVGKRKIWMVSKRIGLLRKCQTNFWNMLLLLLIQDFGNWKNRCQEMLHQIYTIIIFIPLELLFKLLDKNYPSKTPLKTALFSVNINMVGYISYWGGLHLLERKAGPRGFFFRNSKSLLLKFDHKRFGYSTKPSRWTRLPSDYRENMPGE